MTHAIALCGLATLFLAATATCRQEPKAAPSSQSVEASRLDNLVSTLKAQGVTVEKGSEVSQPFFSVKGREFKINGESVQVFEYASREAAEKEAAQVSPNGSSVGTSMMSWISTPHFYKKENLIAIYVGNNPKVLAALQAAAGAQFAGG